MALSVYWAASEILGASAAAEGALPGPASRQKIDALNMSSQARVPTCGGCRAAPPRRADWVINGQAFISHATSPTSSSCLRPAVKSHAEGPKKRITCFLIDRGRPAWKSGPLLIVSHRGYHNCSLFFENCRVPGRSPGEEGTGFVSHTGCEGPSHCRGHVCRTGAPRPSTSLVMRGAPAVRAADWQVPGRLVPARRHGDEIDAADYQWRPLATRSKPRPNRRSRKPSSCLRMLARSPTASRSWCMG